MNMNFLRKLSALVWHKIIVNLLIVGTLFFLLGEVKFPTMPVHEELIKMTYTDISLEIVKLILVFAFYLSLILCLKKRITTLLIVFNTMAFCFYASAVFFVFVLFQFSLFDDFDPRIFFYDGALILLYTLSVAILMIAKDKNLTFSQIFLHQSH